MTTPAASGWPARLAALFAVGLFLVAGVRSTVMQAAPGAPAGLSAPCMSMGAGDAKAAKADHGGKTCAFCAVAGHVPVPAATPVPRPPVAAAWIAWTPVQRLGARGPPAVSPRSRGPPALSLIV